MRWVAVIKTAKDLSPWPGLPMDYPIEVREFATYEEAFEAYPSAQIMSVDFYREWSGKLHREHPSPLKAKLALVPELKPLKRKRWWSWLFFWEKN